MMNSALHLSEYLSLSLFSKNDSQFATVRTSKVSTPSSHDYCKDEKEEDGDVDDEGPSDDEDHVDEKIPLPARIIKYILSHSQSTTLLYIVRPISTFQSPNYPFIHSQTPNRPAAPKT